MNTKEKMEAYRVALVEWMASKCDHPLSPRTKPNPADFGLDNDADAWAIGYTVKKAMRDFKCS